MKRSAILVFAFCFAMVVPVHADLGIAPPPCPDPAPLPPLPNECTITATQTGWSGAVGCLNAVIRMYPQYFKGAAIGYQTDQQNVPRLYANGVAGSGFEQGDVNRIVSLASVTKPLTNVALLKAIQDHMASPDCALLPDGTRKDTCIFPNGVDSRLNIVLLRLDRRNGTDIHQRWFNNRYLGLADTATMDQWKTQDLRIRHIFRLTSGWPTLIFAGYKFCDGPGCQTANDIVCPTNATSGECHYARLYNNYLERRGTGTSAIPDACRPRPNAGPRLFDFENYYNGQVYNATRTAQRFERRYAHEPGLYGECIMTENPATGVGTWEDGRRVTASQVAQFYLGLPLQHKPGTSGRYAQANYYLNAHLVQALTGIPFNAYLKREILTPLGMNDTFFVADKTRPRYAPGGPLHHVSHGSTNPNDHSNDEGGTAAQFARVVDIKRLPSDKPRVVPDVAPGIFPASNTGPDRNWDEGRDGWENTWPEGGGLSTASDLLKFLRFVRNGKAADGRLLLDSEYRAYMACDLDPISCRAYGFATASPGRPRAITGNGYFGGYMERDMNSCLNLVVLAQGMVEPPHGDPYRVQLCDFRYGHLLHLRAGILRMLRTIDSQCPTGPNGSLLCPSTSPVPASCTTPAADIVVDDDF